MSVDDRIDSDQDVHAQIASMARSLHNTIEPPMPAQTPDDVLSEVTATAVRVIPEVDHAGITLVRGGRRPNRKVESVAATGDIPAVIDRLQDELNTGPCLSSIKTVETVRVRDYQTERRWSAFCAAVAEKTPVRSSLSILLYTDHAELGSLNLYSERPDVFTDELTDRALVLAAHGAVAISSARRSEQFRSALASRDTIGQIKGIIMERYGLDAHQAFKLLTELSQHENVRIIDLARQLIDIDHPSTEQPN